MMSIVFDHSHKRFLGLTFFLAMGTLTIASPSPALAADHIVNGNFEYAKSNINFNITGDRAVQIDPLRGRMHGGNSMGADHAWHTIPGGFQTSLYGWLSTQEAGQYNGNERAAKGSELQLDLDGNVYAELVAWQHGTALYQDVTTVPGALYKWSLKHAALASRGGADQMNVLIGRPGAETPQRARRVKAGAAGPSKLGDVGTVIETASSKDFSLGTGPKNGVRDHAGEWSTYEGSYLVPAGQTTTRFTFHSIRGMGATEANGDTVTSGNLLDDVKFDVAYPLYYDANGGSGSLPVPTANDYAGYAYAGTAMTLTSTKPTRAGYRFLGWTETRQQPATSKATYDALVSKLITKITMAKPSKTVFAAWVKDSYTVRAQAVDESGKVLKTIDAGHAVGIGGSWSYTPPAVPGYDYVRLGDGSASASGTITTSNLGDKTVTFVYKLHDYRLTCQAYEEIDLEHAGTGQIDRTANPLRTIESGRTIRLGDSWNYIDGAGMPPAIPGYDYVKVLSDGELMSLPTCAPGKGTLTVDALGDKHVALLYSRHPYKMNVRVEDEYGDTIETIVSNGFIHLGESWSYAQPDVPGYEYVGMKDGSDPASGRLTEGNLGDKTIVFVYRRMVTVSSLKLDVEQGTAVPNAVFDLVNAGSASVTIDGKTYAPGARIRTGIVTGADGSFPRITLPVGTYRLIEMEAPVGYLKREPYTFAVNRDGSISIVS